MKQLKKKWNITSNIQLITILLVFTINGSLSIFLAKPLLHSLNITQTALSPLFFWPLRILIMFIIYQILLVTMGWLVGQHKFFWNMEKKMLARFGLIKNK
ncbi:DUF6787 family protein [Tenacibaculum xiamenense]|uniref:DUF6787 family protein n=1 Tax=Tenacibaculum xiamenense TaxID=1261553 RepID=UPI0038B67CA2